MVPSTIFEAKLKVEILRNLFIEATKLKEVLIEEYLHNYNMLLSDLVSDKNSLANPEYFYNDYKRALEEFNYFDEATTNISEFKYRIPTEDTFVFTDRLAFIKLLINGVAGNYYELPQDDYDKLMVTISGDRFREYISNLHKFFNDDTPKELRFYLMYAYEDLYKIISTILQKPLILFPFSSTSPIDLFSGGIDFFEKEMDQLVGRVISTSIDNVKQGTN